MTESTQPTIILDENLHGLSKFLEYNRRHHIFRFDRGTSDHDIHQALMDMAKPTELNPHKRKVALFTQDHYFLQRLNRLYYLYHLHLLPLTSLDMARIIEHLIETDLPHRTEPGFEVKVRGLHNRGGRSLVLLESAIPIPAMDRT